MRHSMPALGLGLAVALGSLAATAGPADAHDRGRDRVVRKVERVYVVKKRVYRNDSYAARAHDLDPAGNYKGYPDWARVALSPKFDGGNRR